MCATSKFVPAPLLVVAKMSYSLESRRAEEVSSVWPRVDYYFRPEIASRHRQEARAANDRVNATD